MAGDFCPPKTDINDNTIQGVSKHVEWLLHVLYLWIDPCSRLERLDYLQQMVRDVWLFDSKVVRGRRCRMRVM